MKDAAVFRATYSDWRLIKGRKVVQVVFEVPMETANEAYQALGGMPNPAAEVWCGIARLVQQPEREVGTEVIDETPQLTPASVKPPARAHNKLVQLAGMLGKTPLFHRYIESTTTSVNVDEDAAIEFIRGHCGVTSRKEILPFTKAADDFLKLYDHFMLWRDSDKHVEVS